MFLVILPMQCLICHICYISFVRWPKVYHWFTYASNALALPFHIRALDHATKPVGDRFAEFILKLKDLLLENSVMVAYPDSLYKLHMKHWPVLKVLGFISKVVLEVCKK